MSLKRANLSTQPLISVLKVILWSYDIESTFGA